MEQLKNQRKALRTSATMSINAAEKLLANNDVTSLEVKTCKQQLLGKFERLEKVQDDISQILNTEETDEQVYLDDFEKAEVYRDKLIATITLMDEFLVEDTRKMKSSMESAARVKLPELQLQTFDGNPRTYLAFWTQFRGIHEHVTLIDAEKFAYLRQSMVANSKAARMIDSFPPTEKNYAKAIACLQERFGKKGLLIQLYIRDLLALILKNALPKAKIDIGELYDSIESKLLALEALGKTEETSNDFLEPMIESCLPENILRAWERSKQKRYSEHGAEDSSLTDLMKFLKAEVEGEENIKLARTNFYVPKVVAKNASEILPSTCADLVNASSKSQKRKVSHKEVCIFCEKNHDSKKCFQMHGLSVRDRYNILKTKNACLKCFNIGHYVNKCKLKLRCECCGGNHCVLICRLDDNESKVKDTFVPDAAHATVACNKTNNVNNCVYLQTIIILLKNRNHTYRVRALLDSASQRSYISHKAIEALQLVPITQQQLVHTVFGGSNTPALVHQVYRVMGMSIVNRYKCVLNLWSQQIICGSIPKISETRVTSELRDQKIVVPDLNSDIDTIDMLLGADILGDLLTAKGKNIKLKSGLHAISTKFGYTLLGSLNSLESRSVRGISNVSTSLFVQPNDVSGLWTLESLGILDPIDQARGRVLTEEVREQFNSSLERLPGGRYELRLPFRNNQRPYSNKDVIFKRYLKMCSRLKQENLLESYRNVFEEWEKLEIIEQVPKGEMDTYGFYLPHRPVIKTASMTTKIRPVFDASVRIGNRPSLNDCLISGPNLIEDIPDIIDRFRMFPIGLAADVEKAYLQISVCPSHRDFLRFFVPSIGGMSVYRHRRVVFGLTSSPFMLAAVFRNLVDNASKEYCAVAEQMRHSFYVDNCVTGVSTTWEQNQFIEKATKLMEEGCFRLRDWTSNVPSPLVTYSQGNTLLLGLIWNLDEDTLSCKISLPNSFSPSKRELLSVVQRVFDPIGLLCPYTLIPKLIIQDLWNQKLKWDDPLPVDVVKLFNGWCDQMNSLTSIAIPRHVPLNPSSELMLFVDACKTSYAASVFLITPRDSRYDLHLLRAKTRVAPLKSATIPRLELMACTIGARLVRSVQNAIGVPGMKITAWSDSMVALWWIKNGGDWSVFVTNRVNEINKLVSQSSWCHVPGDKNPADLLSRGCMPGKCKEGYWWKNAEWLRQPRDCWPKTDIWCDDLEVDKERRKRLQCHVVVNESDSIWYAKRFSKYRMIIRMVAWMLRFIHNSRIHDVKLRLGGVLTNEEEAQAERVLIKTVQNTELKPRLNSLKIGIFVDKHGIYRVKTRFTELCDEYDFKSPILLPSKCLLTQRLIEHLHLANLHAGTHILLSIIREHYWILRGMRTVRRIVRDCVRCRRYTSKHLVSVPVPLPGDRVNNVAIFEIVGIDLAGPLFLKGGSKTWLVLFTCAVYRAVHLELVTSLSTEIFSLALRRFIARRGRPNIIYTDNGTNFRCASRELSSLDWEKLVHDNDFNRITWKFIPPTAAWWGGWWERIIRMIKELLRRSLGRSTLTYEEMSTVLCSCEAILNSRPLTYISDNMEDLKPLTPAMFLTDRRGHVVDDFDKNDSLSLNRRIKYRAKLLKDLKIRFRKEYLGLLVQAKFKPGRDGHVRTVKLRTATGVFTRPVQQVYPLEVTSTCSLLATQVFTCAGGRSSKDLLNSAISGDSDFWLHEPLELCGNSRAGGKC